MKRVFAKRHRSHSPFRQSDSSDRLPLSFRIRRKHHLHRKTQVLLCELKKAKAFLISRSDLQCFSHEDGCFSPETTFMSSLSELLPDGMNRSYNALQYLYIIKTY